MAISDYPAQEKGHPVLNAITGIRGLACLFIVSFHYFCLYIDNRKLGMEALPFWPHSEFFFTYSKNAVELFFLLAGFLTAWHYRNKIAKMSPGDYFKRHYLKLLGPSIIVNLWAFANAVIQLGTVPGSDSYIPAVNPLRFLLSVLMINTGWFTSYQQTGLPINSTMWFIDVLLLCYIIYFVMCRLARNRRAYYIACTVMILLGWICLEHTPGVPLLWSLDGRGYAPFFIGALLYELQMDTDEALRKKAAVVWGTLILAILLLRSIFGFERIFGNLGSSGYVRYFEFFAAPGLLFCALNLRFVAKFFEWKPFLWLGMLSSAIYYVHNNLMEDYALINDLSGSHVNFSSVPVFLVVIFSIIPAAMLYHYLETKLRQRVRARSGVST